MISPFVVLVCTLSLEYIRAKIFLFSLTIPSYSPFSGRVFGGQFPRLQEMSSVVAMGIRLQSSPPFEAWDMIFLVRFL